MKDRPVYTVWGLTALMALMLVSGVGSAQEYLSPVALVATPDGQTLYVAEATANQVAAVSTAEGKVVKTIALPAAPSGLALSADGKRLFVTAGCVPGMVCVVDVDAGQVAAQWTVGHTPISPVLSPDGKLLYVCNRFDDAVAVLDTATGASTASIAVGREPFAAAITPDGTRLFIANHLPSGPADLDYVAAQVSVVDTAAKAVSGAIQLPNGSTGLRGICTSPDGANVYVTHILGRYHMPTTQLERGWMNTNALSIIDAKAATLVNTVLLDDVDLGAANPWGVACSADGALICVTHAGTHEVSVIDRPALHEKLGKVAAGEQVSEVSRTPDDVPNDLSFLVGVRRRLALPGNGPRGLAVAGGKAYAAEYFTDTVGSVAITADARPDAQSMELGPKQELSVIRKGEMFFNDADLCFQHWQSCASCHPDGRADGLNWDLLNDGIGNPKNSKSMLLSHKTPPVMISGVRDKAETAVRAGIKFIQFAVRPEEDAVAIDEYLKGLTPVPSPYLVDGKLSDAAERGKVVFNDAGCAACHPEPLYTDLIKYNVGTGKDRQVDWEFDTPALVEVWRTGPYLHDGRATTMAEVLKKYNVDERHGKTKELSEDQLKDLAAFVLSL